MPLFKVEHKKVPSTLLTDRFLIPPFSVFDTRQGYWQERKSKWTSLGIQSEIGRKKKLTFYGGKFNLKRPSTIEDMRTSIFDPVLCEITYRWFSRDRDFVLDPFAGGSVRGIIAGALNRHYVGVDLSKEQIAANHEQYETISKEYEGIVPPLWFCGDSKNIKKLVRNRYNLIFSCPPYYDLEVYSDEKADLSNLPSYEDFLKDYRSIIKDSVSMLEKDSFAVFVVGNVRDKKDRGYHDLVGDTIRAFEDAGMIFYNEAVILNVAGTLPIRTPAQFNIARKLGKQHQNYLVFYKGNQKNIKEKFGSFDTEKGEQEDVEVGN